MVVRNTLGVFAPDPDIYPSLSNGAGVLKYAGTNLMDWKKGGQANLFSSAVSSFGGGGVDTSQTGFTLTGGVVFEPGSVVTVHDYVGPLYFDGVLVRQ